MPRLTKSEIERKLLLGESVTWGDASGRAQHLQLKTAAQRRLFSFVLLSNNRQPTNLPEPFVAGLMGAYKATDDPAAAMTGTSGGMGSNEPWKLAYLETEGFGGLNVWNGPPFSFSFEQESYLVEGPNGSGKSSFIGAILWALSGERPRDQSSGQAHESRPVFGTEGTVIGEWPPLATYPDLPSQLATPPKVRVKLVFERASGEKASIERVLENGEIAFSKDAAFDVPFVLIETGMLMPARLALLRLDEGGGRLTSAVQTLTGLDDLIAIGTLAEGLCHKSREYLSYKKRDLESAKANFAESLGVARGALAPTKVPIPDFKPADTDAADGEMAEFGKTLNERAAELSEVISADLRAGLDLANIGTQNRVVAAIEAAKDDLAEGVHGLDTWKTLAAIRDAFSVDIIADLRAAIALAEESGLEAVELLEKSTQDSKFRLKAAGAQWHDQHRSGPVETCPLCELDIKADTQLVQELEALRSAGDAAAKAFDDNINALLARLEKAIPTSGVQWDNKIVAKEPRSALVEELRQRFVEADRYSQVLATFGSLVDEALETAPGAQLGPAPQEIADDVLKPVKERIATVERLIDLADWFRRHAGDWEAWWKLLADTTADDAHSASASDQTPAMSATAKEHLRTHLDRLSNALSKADPYRKAAEAMREAWKSGKAASAIEKEVRERETIAENLSPLKNLGSLAQSVVRETIDGLSARIADLLRQIHLSERLQFQQARLQKKKAGLVVEGGFTSEVRIDATLVANSSWLRAVLWAFVFALRQEAVDQTGADLFPVYTFDDPQATFDAEHRHRWAQYLAGLQAATPPAQIILATHDETFVELIKIDGVKGREALVAAATAEMGHIALLEGSSIDREWAEAKATNTPKAGRDFIGRVREHVEGVLRLLLRGESAQVTAVATGFVLADSREKLSWLNQKGIAPFDRAEFKKLVSGLGRDLPAIKHMEMSHHAGRTNLGMAEAIDVEAHWTRKLAPALEAAFRLAREHRMLHGGLKALHAPPPTAVLPEGYKPKIRSINLALHGRAAALTNGRTADGLMDLSEFEASDFKKITLAQHAAYRLVGATLEPVASPGDILLVKDAGEPSPKSLVVALVGDRLLARRFEVAEDANDVAVLTAQAINPREIQQPVVAHKATLQLHKIVGVLYAAGSPPPMPVDGSEVCDCGGEGAISSITGGAFGLVEVIGRSAEPLALDRQYLILGHEISGDAALRAHDGHAMLVADTADHRYFKRLHLTDDDRIILESLDISGQFPPVVLCRPGKGAICVERLWPVAGVLFELPN